MTAGAPQPDREDHLGDEPTQPEEGNLQSNRGRTPSKPLAVHPPKFVTLAREQEEAAVDALARLIAEYLERSDES